MQLEVGKITEGKVTGITKFGAFVELEPGVVGMVHISEIAPVYVSDIADHLQIGQTVTVKILAVNDDKKISLSIKKALPQQPRQQHQRREFSKDRPQGGQGGGRPRQNHSSDQHGHNTGHSSYPPAYQQHTMPKGPASFEDMLSKFMQSSDEKISDMKRSREVSRRSGQRRR